MAGPNRSRATDPLYGIGTARPPGAQTWRWDWQLFARCRGRDDLFFHPHGEREPVRSEREAAAKAVCFGCPVRRECLSHALEILLQRHAAIAP